MDAQGQQTTVLLGRACVAAGALVLSLALLPVRQPIIDRAISAEAAQPAEDIPRAQKMASIDLERLSEASLFRLPVEPDPIETFSSTQIENVAEEPIINADIFEPLRLVGVVLSNEQRIALLENRLSGQDIKIAEGGRMGDWVLEQLSAGIATFVAGDFVHELALFEEDAVSPEPRKKIASTVEAVQPQPKAEKVSPPDTDKPRRRRVVPN